MAIPSTRLHIFISRSGRMPNSQHHTVDPSGGLSCTVQVIWWHQRPLQTCHISPLTYKQDAQSSCFRILGNFYLPYTLTLVMGHSNMLIATTQGVAHSAPERSNKIHACVAAPAVNQVQYLGSFASMAREMPKKKGQ